MLQAILFDLDGTLLPMDTDAFTQVYFGLLAKTAAPWGYPDPQEVVRVIWDGVKAMVKNDGSRSNYDAFWARFAELVGEEKLVDIPKFTSFYENEFNQAISETAPTPLAKEAVTIAHEKAQKVILATNPIFPYNGTKSRMRWAGLSEEDFDWVSVYENSSYSKPNPAYYQDLLDRFQLDPSQCLMVGNDISEDLEAASAVGIPVYIVNDYVINRQEKDITCPNGCFQDMMEYLKAL